MKNKSIAVIDLKAFYSYVECLDRHLDPWKAPLVVADQERGTNTIVLSVSPFLKKKGIPSRCRLKELPKDIEYIYALPRMERYLEKSAEMVNVLYHFFAEDDVHVYSIDEAFVDISSYLSYYQKNPLQLISILLKQIKDETGLEATAGIGDSFFLSKIALDIYAKKEKNGIALLTSNDIKEKLWPISPLNKVWGIGPRLEKRLNALGIYCVKDIATCDIALLKKKFGVIGEQLWRHANGVDESDIHEEYVPSTRSLSSGQVLFKDYQKDEAITVVREMVDTLCTKMRNEEKMTGVVSLYVGYSKNVGGFAKRTTLLSHTDDSQTIFEAIINIYHHNVDDLPIRRLGIYFSDLVETHHQQLGLFEDSEEQIKRRNLQKALDTLQNKYGKNAVLRGSSLLKESTIRERNELIGGHRR